MKGQERPWVTDGIQATARAEWDAANQDLFPILFFSTDGSAFFILQRFEITTIEDGAGNGRQAWAGLREKFKGKSREAISAEHAKMKNTQLRSGQDPDEYLYIMDSCRGRRQITNMRTLCFRLFHQSIRPLVKLTWKEGTSALLLSDV